MTLVILSSSGFYRVSADRPTSIIRPIREIMGKGVLRHTNLELLLDRLPVVRAPRLSRNYKWLPEDLITVAIPSQEEQAKREEILRNENEKSVCVPRLPGTSRVEVSPVHRHGALNSTGRTSLARVPKDRIGKYKVFTILCILGI